MGELKLNAPVFLLAVEQNHTCLFASIVHLEAESINMFLNECLLRGHHHQKPNVRLQFEVFIE